MALLVWLPLNKEGLFLNQGLADVTVINNGATYDANGKIGGTYECYSGYLKTNIKCSDIFQSGDSFSYSLWIKIIEIPNGTTIDQKRGGCFGCNLYNGGGFGILLYNNGAVNAYICNNTNTDSTTFIIPNLNEWNHYTFTYNKINKQASIYINGNLIKNYTIPFVWGTNNSQFWIGKNTLGGWKTDTHLCINDIRIYDHCLSPKEVHEIAKGLVLHYPMNSLEGGYNLITGLSSGGQTTISNNHVSITGANSNTYFYIKTSKPMISGKSYRISCLGEEFPSSSYYNFPIAGLGNSSIGYLKVKNGYCELYFIANDTCANAGTNIVIDDARKNPGAGIIKNLELIELDTIYDCSGYCNNGTVTGSLQVVDDSPRYKKSTKIINSTISHPLCLSNDNLEWTCCAWIKPTSQSGTLYLNNFNLGNRIYHGGGYPLLYLNSNSNDYYNYGNLKPNSNEWTHIAFVFKNSTGYRHIFINGQDATDISGPNKTSTPFGLPSTITLFSGFNGQVSDYREYSTALSEDDIKELYNTSAIINNNNTLETYEFSEADTYSINKSGVLEGAEFIEQDGEVLINNTEQVFATEFTEI